MLISARETVGFQPGGNTNSPPLCSYYPIVLQSSSARFAMVLEGLRVRSERGNPLAIKSDGRSVGCSLM